MFVQLLIKFYLAVRKFEKNGRSGSAIGSNFGVVFPIIPPSNIDIIRDHKLGFINIDKQYCLWLRILLHNNIKL